MKAPTIDLTLRPLSTTEVSTSTAATARQDEETSEESSGSGMWVPLIGCLLVLWLVVLRPEKKQRKAREAMLGTLKKGDPVVTSGGIHGAVVAVKEDVITIQVADGVRMRFSLQAVQSMPKQEEAAEEKDEAKKGDDSTDS